MVVPLAIARLHRETLTVVFGMYDDAVIDLVARQYFQLRLSIGQDPDIENRTVFSEPGVGPTPVVADADWGNAVDDTYGCCHEYPHLSCIGLD